MIIKNYQDNPWPDSDKQILFIFDASNRIEEDILESWVCLHQHDRQASHVVVRISAGSSDTDSNPLDRALMANDETLVVPLRVAWLPPKEYFESGPRLTHLLFGDPHRPGVFRARRILRNQPDRVHRIVANGATIDELRQRCSRRIREPNPEDSVFSEFVFQQAGLALDLAERRLQGSRYKFPRFVSESLHSSLDYRTAVEAIAKSQGKPISEVLDKTRAYMKEMISTPQRFYLDVLSRFCNFVISLGYEKELVYNQSDLDRLREVLRQHPSIMLWSHKTYIDGFVAPKIFYDNDFPMAHIFGGANMNFLGAGLLQRRSGTIFIRRSFQNNELYKLTLRHYIGYLMDKRFPLQWSLEGTRSRLGKLMPPRYGLLKYVLEACHTTDAENIHIIPVSISYDLIRDVEEYATEQAGRVKKPESLSWFVRYLKSLKRPMGRVYIDVGEPVILEKAPLPDDRLAVSKVAFQVAVEINRVTPITFPALVTMSLLSAAPRALTERELTSDALAHLEWATARGIRQSDDFQPQNAKHVSGVLQFLINEKIIARYDDGLEVLYGIEPEKHPVASYYRNTIVHFWVNKAIIELALVKLNELESGNHLIDFWNEVDRLRDIFKFEFFYSGKEDFHDEVRNEMDRISSKWEEQLSHEKTDYSDLIDGLYPLVAHTVLLTYIEAYRIVAELLAKTELGAEIDEKSLINKALKYGRQAYLQGRISSQASIGRLLFQSGFKLMKNLGLTEPGGDQIRSKRLHVAREIQQTAHRLERIKAIAVTQRNQNSGRS